MVALIDRDDSHHDRLRSAFEAGPDEWVLPWAILPEVDYIVSSRLGQHVARTFLADVASGSLIVEWDGPADMLRARSLDDRYSDLSLGLVDTVVMAMAERLGASAIATLDLRDFAAVDLDGSPELWPRDL